MKSDRKLGKPGELAEDPPLLTLQGVPDKVNSATGLSNPETRCLGLTPVSSSRLGRAVWDRGDSTASQRIDGGESEVLSLHAFSIWEDRSSTSDGAKVDTVSVERTPVPLTAQLSL